MSDVAKQNEKIRKFFWMAAVGKLQESGPMKPIEYYLTGK
jgi:hypothetical protein